VKKYFRLYLKIAAEYSTHISLNPFKLKSCDEFSSLLKESKIARKKVYTFYPKS
jgi:hypothetical protein